MKEGINSTQHIVGVATVAHSAILPSLLEPQTICMGAVYEWLRSRMTLPQNLTAVVTYPSKLLLLKISFYEITLKLKKVAWKVELSLAANQWQAIQQSKTVTLLRSHPACLCFMKFHPYALQLVQTWEACHGVSHLSVCQHQSPSCNGFIVSDVADSY